MNSLSKHNAYFAQLRKGKEKVPGLGRMIAVKDSKLAAEHAWEMDRNNACPKCWMIKNKNGTCPMGC